MVSLTPKSRSEEIIGVAMNEGYFNGTMVLLPSFAGLYAAMQNAKFVKVRTNKVLQLNKTLLLESYSNDFFL
jgi:hypothetical protein